MHWGLGFISKRVKGQNLKTIRSEQDVLALPNFNAASDLDYVMHAVSTIRSALGGQVPLIGFLVALGHWPPIWSKADQVRIFVTPNT